MPKTKTRYADDDQDSLLKLLGMRLPSLMIGLLLGIVLSFVTSRFEEVIAKSVEVAFFIPFIVYMADAVGTQTQSIYIRDLRSGKASFKIYLLKETLLGLSIGLVASVITGMITYMWLSDINITTAVSISMFCAISSAPVVALIIVELFSLEHSDPAVGSGPIATVIQDTLSVLIYGLVCSAIVL
jgi:magnesium transporter